MTKPEAISLIGSLTEKYLNGDIHALKTFPLGMLKEDETYGCPNRKFDSDDTNLMRAIYTLVFSDVWGIGPEDLENYTLRGDTINSYSTLLAPPWNSERFIERWRPDEDFKNRRTLFNDVCYSMGNMMVLPNIAIGEWTINRHRGVHEEWHDYEDRFLLALYNVLTDAPNKDFDLCDLVEVNREMFLPFYGKDGWNRFIKGNMLEAYVDKDYKPIITSQGYTYWRRSGYISSDNFYKECNRYMAFVQRFVSDRADRIILKLEDAMSKP